MGQYPAIGAAALQSRQARIKARLVGAKSPAADKNRIRLCAHRVPVRAGFITRDPATFAIGQRNAAVERGGQFQCYFRTAKPAHGKITG